MISDCKNWLSTLWNSLKIKKISNILRKLVAQKAAQSPDKGQEDQLVR